MKIQQLFLLCFLSLGPSMVSAQTVSLEGFVFEENNRGFLKNVAVKIMDQATKQLIAEVVSDGQGVFKAEVPVGKDLQLVAEKRLFFPQEITATTKGKADGEKVFVKIKMEREPGYIFDVTIAEPNRVNSEIGTNAIDSARIEIFNNTTGKEELVLEQWPYPTFKFTFDRGNYYTIMIRRQGYFNKRIEAWVDVEGCILCFDGLGTVEPGVVDVLTAGNQMGTFLANIELEPLKLNATYKIENIYYDFDKWDIRPDAAIELNKLILILKDNPAITVELGSHTDSRGGDAYNLVLSDKRAAAAVEYILANSEIDPTSITSKGYGETQLVNRCRNGVTCSEEMHQDNRRTQLKITGIKPVDPLENKSLKDILLEEKLMREVRNTKEVKIKAKN